MGSADSNAIEAEGLVKTFRSRAGAVNALDGLNLAVEHGSILALLGPNGAGKTTTVRILATTLSRSWTLAAALRAARRTS